MTPRLRPARYHAGVMDSHHDRVPELHLEFYSRPGCLAAIRSMLDTLCGRLGYDPGAASQICLAIDEALCNVIRHGYDSRPDGRIRLSIHELDQPDRLEFVIEDDARQVDLDTIRSRELDDVRPGGLGVHLINEIMDDVIYEHREGGGMRLRMHKTLPSTGTPVDAGEAEPCK